LGRIANEEGVNVLLYDAGLSNQSQYLIVGQFGNSPTKKHLAAEGV